MDHGRLIGGIRQRYPVNSIVRYQCDAGYTQRHLPVIRCMSDGQWEEPQVECTEGEMQKEMLSLMCCQRELCQWSHLVTYTFEGHLPTVQCKNKS